jgi:hypothetical protein
MLANVRSENARRRKRLVAINALVRPFATVHSHVFIQTRRLAETLAAHGALVWSMLLVHVQDVYAQSITLLERTRAQVTRKLAITLVHASRVLQVLVTVVFVGKHFATPIARIALFV